MSHDTFYCTYPTTSPQVLWCRLSSWCNAADDPSWSRLVSRCECWAWGRRFRAVLWEACHAPCVSLLRPRGRTACSRSRAAPIGSPASRNSWASLRLHQSDGLPANKRTTSWMYTKWRHIMTLIILIASEKMQRKQFAVCGTQWINN